MQVEQRGTAEKHPIQGRIERIAMQQAHAVRPQVMADLVLDLMMAGRAEQAMAWKYGCVVVHTRWPREPGDTLLAGVAKLVEMYSNFHATQRNFA
ncbi:hypothetical protein D9M71_598490 [compost metagenome]